MKNKLIKYFENEYYEDLSHSDLADKILEIISLSNLGKKIQWGNPSFEAISEGVVKVGTWNDFKFEIAKSSIDENEYFLSTIFMNSDIEVGGQENYSYSTDRLKMIAENFVSEFIEKYKS